MIHPSRPLKSVDDLPTVPGMYMAVTNPGDVFARLFILEVDEEGAIHQLDYRTMQRDGVLSPDGWNFDVSTVLYGPYRAVEGDSDE